MQEPIVQNHNNHAAQPATSTAQGDPGEPGEPVAVPQRPWHAEVVQLLQQAAALCIEHGIDVDAYMNGAWSAYVETRPGMRDQLEEAQLIAQLDELRKLGRLSQA
jgi:hypothetical protein